MEALLLSLGFCFAGVIIGWELKSVIQKFKDDKKGMIERDRREHEQLAQKVRTHYDRSIIVEAIRIIEAHQKAKKVFKALREDEDNEC